MSALVTLSEKQIMKILFALCTKIWVFKAKRKELCHFDFLYAFSMGSTLNPIALRKAKIVYNFGRFECNTVKRKRSSLKGKILLIWKYSHFGSALLSREANENSQVVPLCKNSEKNIHLK